MKNRQFLLRIIGSAGIISSAIGIGGAALAHPHVFADTQIGFVFNSSDRVDGLQIKWTYDAFTSLTLYEILDLDADRDGKLDDQDFVKIAEGETNWLADYNGDIWAEGADAPKLGRPESGVAGETDGRIWVSFYLPLETPGGRDRFTIAVYDPSYYYAYTIDEQVPLTDAPGDCTAVVRRVDADDETEQMRTQLAALSREEMPDNPNVGALFAERVVLTCN